MDFFNRKNEISRLNSALQLKKKLVVLIGRRRIGKTRLLQHWASGQEGCIYVQAIESAPELQIQQLWEDIKPWLSSSLRPKTAEDLLDLLSLCFQGKCLIIDEFPYLVAQDSSLPSRLQRRLDSGGQRLPFSLILSGSSQTMMEGQFLNDRAPLYQRADDLFFIQPMDYQAFCSALHLPSHEVHSFELFSLVGGVPKYWEWLSMESDLSMGAVAENLFFAPSAPMNFEPMRLMQDENVNSIRMKAVLDCIGLGDVRPGHMASRMGIKQGSLSVPLTLLTKCGLVERLIPAGHPTKNPKIVQYRLSDPALRFWFETYLVHANRWMHYTPEQKQERVHLHASKEFETFVVANKQAARFWNSECEIDGVIFESTNSVILMEVKWSELDSKKLSKITEKYKILAKKYFSHISKVDLEIYDNQYLKTRSWTHKVRIL